MIKVAPIGTTQDRVRRLEHAINFSPLELPFPAVGQEVTVAGPGTTTFGGLSVDRSVFRQLLPDDRWLIYAAGWLDPGDANGAMISLAYQKDNAIFVPLGSSTFVGAGYLKRTLGPFDLFATAGVPPGEQIPVVRFACQKLVGGNAFVNTWTVWARFLSSKQ